MYVCIGLHHMYACKNINYCRLRVNIFVAGVARGGIPFFRQPIIPTAYCSDGPLFRQPIVPTTHYSDQLLSSRPI